MATNSLTSENQEKLEDDVFFGTVAGHTETVVITSMFTTPIAVSCVWLDVTP